MQPFEYRPVRYWSKEIDGTLPGGRKLIFLIREIDDAAMTAASMETCQFVVPEVSWGRLGSILVACNRLRRLRRRFQCKIHIPRSFALPRYWLTGHDLPKISIQSSLESPKRSRMRRWRLPDPRPIPEGVHEPICIHKK